jgi:hypothetical protein
MKHNEADVSCRHNPVAERFLYALGFDVDFETSIYGPVCIYASINTEDESATRMGITSTVQDRLTKGIHQTKQNTKERWEPDGLETARSLDVLDPDAFVENEPHIVSIQMTLCFSDQSSYRVLSNSGLTFITRPVMRPKSKMETMWRHLHHNDHLDNTSLRSLPPPDNEGTQGKTHFSSQEQMQTYFDVD